MSPGAPLLPGFGRSGNAKDNRMAALGGPSTPTIYSYDPVGGWPSFVLQESPRNGCPSLRDFRRLGTTGSNIKRFSSPASPPSAAHLPTRVHLNT